MDSTENPGGVNEVVTVPPPSSQLGVVTAAAVIDRTGLFTKVYSFKVANLVNEIFEVETLELEVTAHVISLYFDILVFKERPDGAGSPFITMLGLGGAQPNAPDVAVNMYVPTFFGVPLPGIMVAVAQDAPVFDPTWKPNPALLQAIVPGV